MRWIRSLSVVVLGAAFFLACGGKADEPVKASPMAGTWKLIVATAGQDINLAIIKVDVADGKAEATLLSAGLPPFKDAKCENVRVGEKSLHFTLKAASGSFQVAGYTDKAGGRPRNLRGSISFGNNCDIVLLERTTDKEIDPAAVFTKSAGLDELKRIAAAEDDAERNAALKELLATQGDKPIALPATSRVFQHYCQDKYTAAVAAEHADVFVKVASAYGREMELYAVLQCARKFQQRKDGGKEALELARKAEKLLSKNDSLAQQSSVLKVLAGAMRKAEKPDEAALKQIDARIAKLDEELDIEFEKNAVPFKVEPYKGRDGKGTRVAVLELFTGAQCPPCVAADVAFDGLLKTYKPTEVVLIQYHLHVPRPDPLTNADSEQRSEMYDVSGTPSIYINGKQGPGVGGGAGQAKAGYAALSQQLNEVLGENARAGIDLSVKRDGDKAVASVAVTALDTTKDARLRVLLLEDVARYPGTNGQRLHHHVVRGMLLDVEAKLAKGEVAPHKVTIDPADLRKKLADYLRKSNEDRPFLDDERPLELKHLKVVALIQEKESKEILHAVQADVP
jgi:hypothetical protein